MNILDRTLRKSKDAEKAFKHKALLFIPSESYDAATITMLQGLHQLGFQVYTYRKPNINSWWCNQVVNSIPPWLKFDFVLSNMHWGTQWHLYNELKLNKYLKVLIDGCDNRAHHTWRDKYDFYCKKYQGRTRPTDDVLMKTVQPYRWMEPLDGYEPDVVFTSQKNPGDEETIYLPFGIHEQYRLFSEERAGADRTVDFANIPGPHQKRIDLTKFLDKNADRLPGTIHNAKVEGGPWYPLGLEATIVADRNIHSYHRWACHRNYFRLLNRTKVLLYPGVRGDTPHWDSKRPWEAYASGCLVMVEKPPIDMSEYPITELCPLAVWNSLDEMVDKCRYFHSHPGWTEQHRLRAVGGALRHFTPVPIAKYYLWRLKRRRRGDDEN